MDNGKLVNGATGGAAVPGLEPGLRREGGRAGRAGGVMSTPTEVPLVVERGVAYDCGACTSRSLDPSGTGGARWVTRWTTGSDRVRDHTFEGRIPPMNNPTRPDQRTSNRPR